jgi:hypothetical protein
MPRAACRVPRAAAGGLSLALRLSEGLDEAAARKKGRNIHSDPARWWRMR